MSVPRVGVCVLGFHRSGTSMVTRLLNRLGADLGPDEDLLPGVDGDNPEGYFEPRWAIELNDAILAAFGGTYEAPPTLPDGWEARSELNALRATAGERLASAFAGRSLWGIKDPRLSLTLPFWRPLLAQHADELRYVVCVRSPSETAASMLRRAIYGDCDAAHFGRAWLAYTAAALANTRPAERTFAFYDDLLANPGAELHRLAGFIGAPVPGGDVTATVDAGLRHHASDPAATATDAGLSAGVRAAYLALRAARATPALAEALEAVVGQLALDASADAGASRARLADAENAAADLRLQLDAAQARIRRLRAEAADVRKRSVALPIT
jgi:O-antigen biosynthesis protein